MFVLLPFFSLRVYEKISQCRKPYWIYKWDQAFITRETPNLRQHQMAKEVIDTKPPLRTTWFPMMRNCNVIQSTRSLGQIISRISPFFLERLRKISSRDCPLKIQIYISLSLLNFTARLKLMVLIKTLFDLDYLPSLWEIEPKCGSTPYLLTP